VPDPRQDDSANSDWDSHVHSHSSAHHLRGRSGRAKQIVRVIVIIIGVLSLLGYLVNF
jgi:hypothetical protein